MTAKAIKGERYRRRKGNEDQVRDGWRNGWRSGKTRGVLETRYRMRDNNDQREEERK